MTFGFVCGSEPSTYVSSLRGVEDIFCCSMCGVVVAGWARLETVGLGGS